MVTIRFSCKFVSECDALYNSAIEPWGYYLTGTQGLAPNPLWDPLSFAITEAHKRGLDLHAWPNPYRAKATSTYATSSNHITVTQPTWWFTSSADAQKILNPGLPAVKNYIISIIQDIATRYDVDGIHFDDYFLSQRRNGNQPRCPNLSRQQSKQHRYNC